MIWCHLVARVSPLTLVIVDSSPRFRSMIAPTASPRVRWWWEIGNLHLQNKSCFCLASIWGGSWRPLWNSHAYLVFQVHPCVSDLQGGHEGELLEIDMQGFLDYLHKKDPYVWGDLDKLIQNLPWTLSSIWNWCKISFLAAHCTSKEWPSKFAQYFSFELKIKCWQVSYCALVHFGSFSPSWRNRQHFLANSEIL